MQTDAEAKVGVHTIVLTTEFLDYPVSADVLNPQLTTTITITIVAATCDCSLILFQNLAPYSYSTMVMKIPADRFIMPEAGIDQATLTQYAGARACVDAMNTCQFAYVATAQMANAAPLPSWMSYAQPYLTVSPTSSAHIGVWNVYLKQVKTST